MAKQAKKVSGSFIGAWAFLIGVILAIVAGFLGGISNPTLAALLVIAGLVVGLFNISDKEVLPFLWASAILVFVSSQGAGTLLMVPKIGIWMAQVLGALMLLFIPATIIVAMKTVFAVAKR